MHGTCAEHDNEELHHTEEQRSDRPAYAITHIVALVRVTLLRGKVNGAVDLGRRYIPFAAHYYTIYSERIFIVGIADK